MKKPKSILFVAILERIHIYEGNLELFWKKRDCYLLAIALIINEQSYLEKRIIQNPLYKEKVFNTLEFVLQDLLSFNHILFPFRKR